MLVAKRISALLACKKVVQSRQNRKYGRQSILALANHLLHLVQQNYYGGKNGPNEV